MDEKYKQLQRDYAEEMVSIRDTVLCMYENRKLVPLHSYDIYRPMLDRYLKRLAEIVEQIREGDVA